MVLTSLTGYVLFKWGERCSANTGEHEMIKVASVNSHNCFGEFTNLVNNAIEKIIENGGTVVGSVQFVESRFGIITAFITYEEHEYGERLA